MFDAKLRPLIDPPLNRLGSALARRGVTANAITFLGLALGLAGAAAISGGYFGAGLGLILANRLLDGLDGDLNQKTNRHDEFIYLCQAIWYPDYESYYDESYSYASGIAG